MQTSYPLSGHAVVCNIAVGDLVKIKGYDRVFKVGGVVGIRPDLSKDFVETHISVGFQGFGGACQTSRLVDEFEKVET